MYFFHGASKNKIYDNELFKKKSGKLTNIPQKRKENLFSLMNLDPPPNKNYFSRFFSKSFVYSLKDIYIQIELV